MNDDQAISQLLPGLEREVFEAVRESGSVSVSAVAKQIAGRQRPLAYTTVMTVLTRLFQKGYLIRRREGKAYLYEARPAADIVEGLASKAAQEAISRFGDVALSGLVHTLTPDQRALLEQLLRDGRGEPGAGEVSK